MENAAEEGAKKREYLEIGMSHKENKAKNKQAQQMQAVEDDTREKFVPDFDEDEVPPLE